MLRQHQGKRRPTANQNARLTAAVTTGFIHCLHIQNFIFVLLWLCYEFGGRETAGTCWVENDVDRMSFMEIGFMSQNFLEIMKLVFQPVYSLSLGKYSLSL